MRFLIFLLLLVDKEVMGIALIDARLPLDELSKEIATASEQLGFLYLSNSGLDPSRIFDLSKRFFQHETLPDKLNCAIADNKGYARIGQESLDPSKPGDAKECAA
jgi:isopenicillin N synthase-like dioxygenase